MKNGKKLLLALLLATVVVVPAEAYFRGTMEKEEWHVLIDGTDTAVTVSQVRGTALKLVGSATARTGQPASLSGKMPKNATRMIVEVDTPLGGTAKITIEQGTRLIEDATAINGDTRFVFDVAP